MRRRRHVREVELRHLPDGGKNVVQLLGQPRDLVLAQLELRERRDVKYVLSRDCHVLLLIKLRRRFGGAAERAIGLCPVGRLNERVGQTPFEQTSPPKTKGPPSGGP